MLTNILTTVNVEQMEHEQQTARKRAKISRRILRLQTEKTRHPERAEHLESIIEAAEAELRKKGGL